MASKAEVASSTSGWTTRRKISLGMTLTMVVVLVAVLVARATGFGATEVKVPGVPGLLGNQKLTRAVTGQEAQNQIGQLHARAFTFNDAYIAYYKDTGQESTAWVAVVGESSQAQQLLKAMVDRIGQGDPTFTNLQKEKVEGKEVYSADGTGQKHYFFARGNRVIWLATSLGGAPSVLQAGLAVSW